MTAAEPSRPRILRPRPISAEAIAPFGRVATLSDMPGRSVNEGRGTRIDLPGDLDHDPAASSRATALYDIVASPLPFEARCLERHALSEQLFVATGATCALVVVAPDDQVGQPDLDRAEAFLAPAGTVLVYGAGVWHLPLVALGEPGRFLMQTWECGGPADCEVVEVSAGALVVVA